VRSSSSGLIPEKNNHMKKYITFDSVAFAMAVLTFFFIFCTLCAACVNLQERALEKEINIFDQLEKPL
jgi:hypothetical protein